MLIGLLAKNAILIVEYAIQRRQMGLSIVEAAVQVSYTQGSCSSVPSLSIVDVAVQGAVARLRPILMTSFAFIAGLTPLFFATGADSVGNRSIGISAIGGMLIGTVFGLLVIPSLCIVFQSLQEKIGGTKRE